MGNSATAQFGVHSEVGKLRKVMVHRPDLSLKRLTPSNRDELLFDDVLWVEQAQQEHDQFVRGAAQSRRRGVPTSTICSPRRWQQPGRAGVGDRAHGQPVHRRADRGRRGARGARRT